MLVEELAVAEEGCLFYAMGLRDGDVVVRVDGADVTRWSDLEKALRSLASEGGVVVEIERGRVKRLETLTFEVR